jgi:hypothetical protein
MKIKSYSTSSVFDPYSISSVNNTDDNSITNDADIINNSIGTIYNSDTSVSALSDTYYVFGGWTVEDNSKGMTLYSNSFLKNVSTPGNYIILWSIAYSYTPNDENSNIIFGISKNNATPDTTTFMSNVGNDNNNCGGSTILYLNINDTISLKFTSSSNATITSRYAILSAILIN